MIKINCKQRNKSLVEQGNNLFQIQTILLVGFYSKYGLKIENEKTFYMFII